VAAGRAPPDRASAPTLADGTARRWPCTAPAAVRCHVHAAAGRHCGWLGAALSACTSHLSCCAPRLSRSGSACGLLCTDCTSGCTSGCNSVVTLWHALPSACDGKSTSLGCVRLSVSFAARPQLRATTRAPHRPQLRASCPRGCGLTWSGGLPVRHLPRASPQVPPRPPYGGAVHAPGGPHTVACRPARRGATFPANLPTSRVPAAARSGGGAEGQGGGGKPFAAARSRALIRRIKD